MRAGVIPVFRGTGLSNRWRIIGPKLIAFFRNLMQENPGSSRNITY